MEDTLQFESEDELRKPIPEDTVAKVQIRAERDRELGDFRSGESQYGPWMSLPFEVIEGEHKGEWVSLMLNVKTDDRRFRKAVEVVTGKDLSAGAQVTLDEFKEKVLSGVFEANLGPDKRKNKETGQMEETGYSRVNRLEKRVGERDASTGSGSDDEVPAASAGDSGDPDDIPF